jgi:CRP/FNR family transcriptional regulator, cyclic AMP receptor protein
LDEDVRRALASGWAKDLKADRLEALVRRGKRIRMPGGATAAPSTVGALAAIVLSGLIRLYLSSQDGRQVTVRYLRMGDFVLPVVRQRVPVGVQSLTASEIWGIPMQAASSWAQSSTESAWAIARALGRELHHGLEQMHLATFGTVRQRLARHLLDVAAAHQTNEQLVVSMRPQDIADCVGTVREVASRALRELCADATLVKTRSGYVIRDAVRLYKHAETE